MPLPPTVDFSLLNPRIRTRDLAQNKENVVVLRHLGSTEKIWNDVISNGILRRVTMWVLVVNVCAWNPGILSRVNARTLCPVFPKQAPEYSQDHGYWR